MMAGAAGRRPPPRPMGGPFGGVGLPAEKPKDFKGTFRRLVKTLSPELPRILLVVAFAIVSVTFAVVGPKILGNATDIIFNGVVGQQIPAGADQGAGGRRAQRGRPDAAGADAREHERHARRRASTSRPCATPCCSSR